MKLVVIFIGMFISLQAFADNDGSISTLEQVQIKHSGSVLNKEWKDVNGVNLFLEGKGKGLLLKVTIFNPKKTLCEDQEFGFININFKGRDYKELINCQAGMISEIDLMNSYKDITNSLIKDKRINIDVSGLGMISFSAIGFQKAIDKVFFPSGDNDRKQSTVVVSSLASITGNDFINNDDELNFNFLNAVYKGVISTVAGTTRDNNPRLTCFPDRATNGQIYDVVKKYIYANPAARHKELTVLATDALVQAFPCK